MWGVSQRGGGAAAGRRLCVCWGFVGVGWATSRISCVNVTFVFLISKTNTSCKPMLTDANAICTQVRSTWPAASGRRDDKGWADVSTWQRRRRHIADVTSADGRRRRSGANGAKPYFHHTRDWRVRARRLTVTDIKFASCPLPSTALLFPAGICFSFVRLHFSISVSVEISCLMMSHDVKPLCWEFGHK